MYPACISDIQAISRSDGCIDVPGYFHIADARDLEILLGDAFLCFFLFFATEIKILPFAAVQSMQFLRCQEELLHNPILGIEFHEFTIHEGVEPAQVRTHTVCRQCHAGNMEVKGLTVFRTGVTKTRAVQAKNTAADDFRGGLIFQQLIFRQHTKLHLLFQNEILLLHFLANYFPLQIEPGSLGLGDHAGIVKGNQLIGIQQSGTVAAFGAEDGIALGGHGMLLAAAGAPEQQVLKILRAVFTDVVVVLVDLVPGIIIVIDGPVDLVLDLGGGHGFQLLHRKQLVKLHLHMARPVPEVILGAGQIAAPDDAVIDGNFVMLEQLASAQSHRLVGTGNGAHALGEDADSVAGFDYPADLLHRIKIRCEILLGDDPQKIEHQGQMTAVELVIACHKVHLQGQQRRTNEDIVKPGGMVADEEEGSFDLTEVLLKVIVDLILGINKQLPGQSQGVVYPIGMADLS